MSTEAVCGTLDDVPIRHAWTHEAHGFTPWLVENLDRLSQAIGIPLKHTGTEVAVESFSADILARNPLDDSNVLIENQLEVADHRHLGQILTYLAGLGAQTIVWVAPSFRPAHLSAVRWLNEHTADPFAFFAVQLRVVRIGDSPLAPLFDVLERPNDWDRRLQEVARESRDISELGVFRKGFWTHFVDRYPSERNSGGGSAASSRWRQLPGLNMVLAQYLSKSGVGVFVRGDYGVDPIEVAELLEPVGRELETRLEAPLGPNNNKHFLGKHLDVDAKSEANWDQMADWLKSETDRYEAALLETLTDKG
jgi:hypothetical protein